MTQTSRLQIVKADALTGTHLDEFLSLTEEYFRENWPHTLEGHGDWRAHYSEWLKTRAKEGGRHLWIVRLDGKTAGLANFYSTGPDKQRVGHVAEFYVRPDLRRRGMGRELFALVRDQLLRDGCQFIKSEVQPDQPGRMTFWENLGFTVEKVLMSHDLRGE